jgi:hypothetical protein
LTPIQRSGSGSHRGLAWPTHGSEVRITQPLRYEVGQRPGRDLRGGHPVTDVATRGAKTVAWS